MEIIKGGSKLVILLGLGRLKSWLLGWGDKWYDMYFYFLLNVGFDMYWIVLGKVLILSAVLLLLGLCE